MISLAARVWKLDADAAAARLADGDDPGEVRDRVGWVAEWDRMSKLTGSLKNVPTHLVRAAMKDTGMTPPSTPDHWKAGLGRFCGVSTRKELSETVREYASENRRRMMEGREMEDPFLVVPFEDVPGRVSGLWVCRTHTLSDAFLTATGWASGDAGSPRATETGFGFLAAALSGPDPLFGDTVFAIDDAFVAMRVHDRRFQTSSTPLPVVATRARERYRARNEAGVFDGRPVVLWGRKTTRELLRQAVALDARVATSDEAAADDRACPHALAKLSPVGWLQALDESAIPWKEAVEKYLSTLTPDQTPSAIDYMGMTSPTKRTFLSWCSEQTRERVDRAGGVSSTKKVAARGRMITEKNGEWWADTNTAGKRTMVSSGTYRIDEVVRYEGRDKMTYRGRAFLGGNEVPFSADVKEFEDDPLGFVKGVLLKAGAGVLAYSGWWSRDTVGIATQMHPPAFVTGTDSYGWNERAAAWIFPTFQVDARGEVSPRQPDPGRRGTAAEWLAPPADVHPDAATVLSEVDETSTLCWGAVASVVANLIAPACDRDTSGILFSGEAAQSVGPVAAAACGCRYAAGTTAGAMAWRADRMTAAEKEDGWPILFTRPPFNSSDYSQTIGAFLRSSDRRNCALGATRYEAASWAVSGGWHVVEGNYPAQAAAGFRTSAAVIVPSFLRWFGRNGLAVPRADTFGEAVVELLARWADDVGIDRRGPRTALGCTRFDHGGRTSVQADRFGELLCYMQECGNLQVREAQKFTKIVYLEPLPDDNLFIPKARVNKLLAAEGAPPVDTTAVSRALAAEGVLVTESDRGDPPAPGWVVPRGWWDKRLSTWRRRFNRFLRVVS